MCCSNNYSLVHQQITWKYKKKNTKTLTCCSLEVKMARWPPISVHFVLLVNQSALMCLLRKKHWSPTWNHPWGHLVQLITVRRDRQKKRNDLKTNIKFTVTERCWTCGIGEQSIYTSDELSSICWSLEEETTVPGAEQLAASSEYFLHRSE